MSQDYVLKSEKYVRKLERERDELLEAAKGALDVWLISTKEESVAYEALNEAINKAEGKA